MPRAKINKSQAIRDYIRDNPDAGPTAVVEALAKSKIKVSGAAVSNVKARMSGGPKSKRGRKASNGTISVDDLLAAKRLANSIGLDRARSALDALARLS